MYQRVLGLQDLRWEMCVLSAEKACISDGEKEAQIKNFFHETNHVMFCLPCDYVLLAFCADEDDLADEDFAEPLLRPGVNSGCTTQRSRTTFC